MRNPATILSIFFVCSFALALDITTVNGKIYRDVKVQRVEPDCITIFYPNGASRVAFTNLSPDVQAAYGYDAEKAEAYRREKDLEEMQRREAKAKRETGNEIVSRVAARSESDRPLTEIPREVTPAPEKMQAELQRDRLPELATPRITVDLGGEETLELVWIMPGGGTMGSNEGHFDETPVRRVTSGGFWMGKYEVTQGQWERVMGGNPSAQKGARKPVEKVSWQACQEFIRKLNALQGLAILQIAEFRLPNEIEWEYCCRAGTPGRYAGDLEKMGWYVKNSLYKTHAVGEMKPNPWGLYDMHGNVWEWCSNPYFDYSGTFPVGNYSEDHRMARGGCWSGHAADARSATRKRVRLAATDSTLGLRLVLSPFPSPFLDRRDRP